MSFMNQWMKIVRTSNSLDYQWRRSQQAHRAVWEAIANPIAVGIGGAIALGIITAPIWGGALWVFYKLAFDYNMPITAFIVAMMGLGIVAFAFRMIDVDEPSKPVEPNTASSDELYADGWKSEDFD